MERHNLAPDESTTPVTASPGQNLILARTLSIVFSPPLMVIVSYLLIAFIQPTPIVESLGWVLLTMLVQMGPSVVLYTHRRRTGVYRDADVSNRRDRNELYAVGATAVLLSIILLQLLGAPRDFLALAIGALVLGVCCGLVNLFWKISMHASAIGALATITALLSPIGGAVMWFFALAVGWARVRTRNHTPMQVLAGLTASALITFGAFVLIAGR
jgi:membrane-associated phospholipid phosphatase